MEVMEWREISAVKGESIDNWPIAMGVDEKGRECVGLESLRLQVFLNDLEVEDRKIEIIEDGSREKRLRLTLDRPVSLEPVVIKWTYIWPGGFEELLADGRGEGTFLIVERTASLYVEFESEAHDIKEFKVVYHNASSVEYLYEQENRRRAFEIKQPTRTQIVQFDVAI